MNYRFSKGRALSLLLVLAMLIVSIATLLPITASADGEIQNFGVQHLSAINLRNDETTDLRFVFTVGNLDYEKVGIVISKKVAIPTYNAANCYTYETGTVYSSINVEGTPTPAPGGRWWVACKMTGIPHSFFDGALYVRAFVKNENQAPIYTNVETVSVCSVCNHVHTEAWNAEGTATMQSAGSVTGVCPGCNLSVTFDDVTRTPVIFDSKNPTVSVESALLGPRNSNAEELNKTFLLSKSAGEIRGDKHFYPASKSIGADDGNDLWFEYSFLMNETFWNYNVFDSEMKAFSFRKADGDKPSADHRADFYLMYGLDREQTGPGVYNRINGDCPYKGHFDYTSYASVSPSENCADDLTDLGNSLNGNDIGRYTGGWIKATRQTSPYLYDAEYQDSYGWHRLGFRYHQEVESIDDSTVTYAAYTEMYIDGILVWRVHSDAAKLKNQGVLLWTANASSGNIDSYSDNDDVLVQMYVGNVVDSTNPVFIAVGDVYWTCGDGFVMQVERNDTPGSEKITLGGNQYDAGYYYTEASTAKVAVYKTSTNGAPRKGEYKSLTAIRGDDHFYPDASNGGEGRNLYFEYDFLWNESLYNWNEAEINVMAIRRDDTGKFRGFYYLYTKDGKSGDCPYKGHFDYSTYKSDALEADNAEDLTSEGNYLFGDPVGRYVAGWGSANPKQRSYSPYIYDSAAPTKGGTGWHRIGVMMHQEASLDGNNVVYTGWTELYINGVKVWKVYTAMQGFSDGKGGYKSLEENGLLLFTGEKDGSEIVYTDAVDDVKVGYQFYKFQASPNPAYAIFANVNWRIVDVDFAPSSEIEPVNSPTAANYKLPNGSVVDGRVFYRVK